MLRAALDLSPVAKFVLASCMAKAGHSAMSVLARAACVTAVAEGPRAALEMFARLDFDGMSITSATQAVLEQGLVEFCENASLWFLRVRDMGAVCMCVAPQTMGPAAQKIRSAFSYIESREGIDHTALPARLLGRSVATTAKLLLACVKPQGGAHR